MNVHLYQRILVIRRDNIGDLLCTTPLLAALRQAFPQAWLAVLTNSYAAPVLKDNPDIDALLVYEKGKHVGGLGGRTAALFRRIRLIMQLRQQGIDLALLPASGQQDSAERFARLIAARRVIRADEFSPAGPHEVESAFRCASALGIAEKPGPMRLSADSGQLARLAEDRRFHLPAGPGPLIGLHISARKLSQRWPIDRYAALAQRLHHTDHARFLLFWAPGAADDARHPGDDALAGTLLEMLSDVPVVAFPTHHLSELIAGLSMCQQVFCSDGGAMHIAAALGKPMVCFFGNSGAERWHPWGVRYELLQPESRQVIDISVDAAINAWGRLMEN